MKLLDAGSINIVTSWGSDAGIIDSARMSTDGGFVSWEPYEGHPKGDAGLLAYLYNNKHMTPFEMAGAIFEIKAPIFVFREWHRHRTQSYNEMSARYIPLPNEDYMPSIERILSGANTATSNKQAQGSEGGKRMTPEEAAAFQSDLRISYQTSQLTYERSLEAGAPKELARLILPVARYSKMRASANLRNWMAFITLRDDPAAQYEIRVYAEAIADTLRSVYPHTMALFDAGRTK